MGQSERIRFDEEGTKLNIHLGEEGMKHIRMFLYFQDVLEVITVTGGMLRRVHQEGIRIIRSFLIWDPTDNDKSNIRMVEMIRYFKVHGIFQLTN